MKNILQLFKKMQPKSYYGAGIAVKACEDKTWREEDLVYTSNTDFSLSGCTVEETTDCRNIYSVSKANMPVQGIGLMKTRNIR